MTEWLADGFSLLILCIGFRVARPRFLRRLFGLSVCYLVIFAICYYLWLSAQYDFFKSHPGSIHHGIAAAFQFDSFWQLFAGMLLLKGIMPIALVFFFYCAVKRLAVPGDQGSRPA